MFYTNVSFVILFILLAILVRVMPFHLRKYVLTAVSLLIIATWGWASLIIFLFASVLGFIFADLISQKTSPGFLRINRWYVLSIGVAFNILLLVIFKYREFLLGENFATLITGPLAEIGIPLGVSFYSFHIISYLIDLYRGQYQRAKFIDFLFYLSFFPHVIAGPIVRGWQLLPQLKFKRKAKHDLVFGAHLFITGFFLKTVCADNIGGAIDPYWAKDAPALSMVGHWLVALYYYFQLYGDFAGYSLMACGMARLLGYRLPINFRYPMCAIGFQDFWRRWHITLSRWLRDYLYIPLGGNRLGAVRTCLNLLIVMALGGLWHGPAWTFLVWGLLHGGGLLVERLLGAHRVAGWKIPAWWLTTQVVVVIAWVFFRSPSLEFASQFIHQMFNFQQGYHVDKRLLWVAVYTLPIVFHHLAPWLVRKIKPSKVMSFLGSLSSMSFLTSVIVQSPSAVFIYFAF